MTEGDKAMLDRVERAGKKRERALRAFEAAYQKMRRATAKMEAARRAIRQADRTLAKVYDLLESGALQRVPVDGAEMST